MSTQSNDRMSVFKKAFFILLVLDMIGLILAIIAFAPTFKQMAEFGQPMIIVFGVMIAVVAAIQLFEIFAKVFLIKSTSPTFSWAAGRSGCIAVATLLLVFNFGAVIINLLSAGGEGATLINQANLYLRMLASAAEIIIVFLYLRKVKKISD